MKFENFDEATTIVAGFIRTAKSVSGFEVREPIKGFVLDMAKAIEAGQNNVAVEKAGSIMSIGRSVLGKYIRFAVVDQQVEGKAPRVARFRWQIEELVADSYHEDILAGLWKKFDELAEAVRLELNGAFDLRVAAYNAMAKAIETARIEQARRDRVRDVRAKAGFDKPKPQRQPKMKQVDDSPEAVAARAARAAELTALL